MQENKSSLPNQILSNCLNYKMKGFPKTNGLFSEREPARQRLAWFWTQKNSHLWIGLFGGGYPDSIMLSEVRNRSKEEACTVFMRFSKIGMIKALTPGRTTTILINEVWQPET